MSKTGCIISHEGIEYLVGLIRDISGLDTKLIDDINLKTNGSWSSVHTKNMIDQSLTDSKAYVDKLIGALNKLSSKKTTVQPTLDNSEFNVIYLYSSSGSAPFDQYLKIGTNDSDAELVSLGSTNIDLTDYLTVTDADSTYCKKTDFDTLKTALTTHTSDTDIHITSAERTKWNEVDNKVNKTDIVDNLTSTDTDKPLSANQGKVLKDEVNLKANDDEVVKKTDITTTINSTSTDTQVPSAKSIKTELDLKEDVSNKTTTINSSSTNTQYPSAKSVYNLAGNENRRGYVYNNPTYRGDTWNRVFRVNSLLSCDSGFLTVTVYSSGLCEIATFLMSKNFNRLNVKQINCGGYNGNDGQGRPIKVRIISAETSICSFLEIFISGTSNTNVVATYMPLSCDSVVVLNEKGSIPGGMFACEMTATHDTYSSATYTSILK